MARLSDAAARFREATARDPYAAAKAIGTNAARVAKWLSGDVLPTPPWRAKIEEAYGIEAAAWTRGVPVPAPVVAEPRDGSLPDSLDGVRQLVASTRALRGADDLTGPQRLKLVETEAKLLSFQAKLEHERALLENRLVREHPHWRKLRDAIVEALKHHPEALRDVEEAISRVDQDQ